MNFRSLTKMFLDVLLYILCYGFAKSCDGIKHFTEYCHFKCNKFSSGYCIENHYCVYDTCFYRKQLEDILANLKEKPDVGTLLLVSH